MHACYQDNDRNRTLTKVALGRPGGQEVCKLLHVVHAQQVEQAHVACLSVEITVAVLALRPAQRLLGPLQPGPRLALPFPCQHRGQGGEALSRTLQDGLVHTKAFIRAGEQLWVQQKEGEGRTVSTRELLTLAPFLS